MSEYFPITPELPKSTLYISIGCDPSARLITNGHSSSSMLTKNKSGRTGERVDHWFARVRPAVKKKPSLLYEKEIKLSQEVGRLRGFYIFQLVVDLA